MLRLLRLLVTWLLFSLLLPLSASADVVPVGSTLDVGVVVERVVSELDRDDDGRYVESFELAVPRGPRVVVFAEQSAADVRLEATWAGLDEAWRVDSPLDYDGVEVLLLPPSAGETVELTVTAVLPGGDAADADVRAEHPSRFRLRVEAIPHGGAQVEAHRARLDALGWLTVAGRAWSDGEGEGRRRALDFYGRVADQPTALAGSSEGHVLAAQAVYCRAVLHRLLGEHGPAKEHAQQALEAWRELGDRARLADTWNEIGLVAGPAGDLDAARDAYTEALGLAQELGDPFREAFVRGNLCLVELMANRLRQGIDCYESALPSVRRIGAVETESAFLVNMAQAHRVLGDLEAAADQYRLALGFQGEQGLVKLEAQTRNNLAGVYLKLGEMEKAQAAYSEAAARFESLGDVRWQARSLHNLAKTLLRLGDAEAAVGAIERAVELHRSVGHRSGEASALRILGQVAEQLNDASTARQAFAESLAVEEELGDEAGAAAARVYLARLDLAEGDVEAASARLDGVLDVARRLDRPEFTAWVLLERGRVAIARGQVDRATSVLEEALGLYADAGDPFGEALTRLLQAEAEIARSADGTDASQALDRLRLASEDFDAVTRSVSDSDLRALFAGSQRRAKELYVDQLVAAGDLAVALQVSETARTWGLRAALGGSKPELAGGESLGLEGMQGLLDDETLLLQFFVGESRSHLFVLDTRDLTVVSLPGEAELAGAVAAARAVWERPSGASLGGTEWADLSQLLLGEIWPRIDRPGVRRLVSALDGPLHGLPFAALPMPGGDTLDGAARRLVQRFELVRIPSASVLAMERRRRSARAAAAGFAAVLADPIFSARDLRLPATASTPEASTPPPVRLRWSRREADAVVAAARGQDVVVALDGAASREWLLTEDLKRFRILHFATHARLDHLVASRSGLELSAYEDDGSPRDGFVSQAELRQLDLNAELVVLSACRTALGREVRGEGLVGLVQAFLEAGAARVLASLRPVSDRVTTDLVTAFYEALADGRSPSAALRQAQIALADDPATRPADWSGFVLVGDWR